MSFTFRPAVRAHIPTIVGLAGPTKSGKTYSALRLAKGMANGGPVFMLNAEGPKGHLYADKFDYLACDIEAPFSPKRYTEAVLAAAKENPAVLIIDSASHMHDGPGGLLEFHDAELQRLAGNDFAKRDRNNFTAWIKPKADENEFIYALLGLKCHVILCFRAKEKLKIVPGKQPENLGWQPIAGDRITFETLFTLTLPPFSKGVPDLSLSEMRDPFDRMIRPGVAIDEALGKQIAEFSNGGDAPAARRPSSQGGDAPAQSPAGAPSPKSPANEPPVSKFWREVRAMGFGRDDVLAATDGVEVDQLDPDLLDEIVERLRAKQPQQASLA